MPRHRETLATSRLPVTNPANFLEARFTAVALENPDRNYSRGSHKDLPSRFSHLALGMGISNQAGIDSFGARGQGSMSVMAIFHQFERCSNIMACMFRLDPFWRDVCCSTIRDLEHRKYRLSLIANAPPGDLIALRFWGSTLRHVPSRIGIGASVASSEPRQRTARTLPLLPTRQNC